MSTTALSAGFPVKSRWRNSRFVLLIVFAFSVMADPASSVAYAIEAAPRALHGRLDLLVPAMAAYRLLLALGLLTLVALSMQFGHLRRAVFALLTVVSLVIGTTVLIQALRNPAAGIAVGPTLTKSAAVAATVFAATALASGGLCIAWVRAGRPCGASYAVPVAEVEELDPV